jgi:hypothetical protein
LTILLFCICLLDAVGECGELFASKYLATGSTTLSVLPVDLDNAGASEIIVVSRTGVFPHENDGFPYTKPDTGFCTPRHPFNDGK